MHPAPAPRLSERGGAHTARRCLTTHKTTPSVQYKIPTLPCGAEGDLSVLTDWRTLRPAAAASSLLLWPVPTRWAVRQCFSWPAMHVEPTPPLSLASTSSSWLAAAGGAFLGVLCKRLAL